MTALRSELAAAEKHAEDLRQAANIEEMLLKNDVVKQKVYDSVYAPKTPVEVVCQPSEVKKHKMGMTTAILKKLHAEPSSTRGALIKHFNCESKRVMSALGGAGRSGLLEIFDTDRYKFTDKGWTHAQWLVDHPKYLKYMGASYYTRVKEVQA